MEDEEIKNTIEEADESKNKTVDLQENSKKKKSGFLAHFARLLIWGGIAFVPFAVFFVWFMLKEAEKTADYAPEIVIMGDSIFASTTDETSIACLLAERMNTEVADVSFGGSCMSYIDRDARLDNNHDAFCMAALTQAVLSNDFRYQESANVRLIATEYFDERIELLKSIDFKNVDTLIINHLLNDYQIAAPISSGSDDYDEYTYEGALRSVITQLKDAYPGLRIIIVSPVKSWYTEECIVSGEYDAGGGTVYEYIEVQKSLAEECGLEWISLYELYDDINLSADMIHPNAEARQIIADYLYEYLANGE